MTSYDEHNKNYLQVGIAEINPDDNIGETLVEKFKRFHDESSLFVLAMLFLLLVLGGCAIFVVIKKKREGTLGIFEERKFVEYFTKVDNVE